MSKDASKTDASCSINDSESDKLTKEESPKKGNLQDETEMDKNKDDINTDDDLLEQYDENEDEPMNDNYYELEAGDHIYSWRALGAYSHHGIVLSVTKVSVAIIDFYPSSYTSSINETTDKINHEKEEGIESQTENIKNEANSAFITSKVDFIAKQVERLRILNLDEWKTIYGRPRKVAYNAPYLKRAIYRSGTCCSMESLPPFLVLARARFLLLSPDQHDIDDSDDDNTAKKKLQCYIPKHHALHANSETLSVWCKTGHFSTLQVADFLHLTWAGQLKSSFALTAYLSSQTVQIPAAGVWGYLGFTSKVALLSSQPILIPAVIGYGAVTVGGPLWMLRKCHHVWEQTENTLNNKFWSGGVKEGDVQLNDVVIDCIEYWYLNRN